MRENRTDVIGTSGSTSKTMDSVENKKNRILTYIGTFLVLFLGFGLLRSSGWRGSTQLHTLMESIATLLALLVGVVALLRYYTKKNNTILFIGVGFLGTSLLDGYHAVVTSASFSQFWPSPPPSLIPWSWNASRIFLSVLMLLSFLMWKREQRLGERGRIQEKTIFLTVGALTLASFLLFAVYPLPHAYYSGVVFGRPEEFISAFIFLLALIGYLRKGWWKHNQFEHWVVLSLIVGVMGQAMFMSMSTQLFDGMFDAAHLLKKVSYICVKIGLLISLYYVLREAEEGKKAVEQANEALQREIVERRHTEVALRRRDAILEAVSYAARRLMNVSSWEEPTDEILSRLGSAAEVSRVYVFENHVGEKGELLTSQRHEWAAPGIVPQIDNPDLQNIDWVTMGFERWIDQLGRGAIIHGHVREFPESERKVLKAQDIRSIIVVPIFVGQDWWGLIGFDECLVERPWLAVELDALSAAAGTLGAAIQCLRAVRDLKESEERYRTIFEAASEGIVVVEIESRKFRYANPALCEMLGYTEEELTRKGVADIHPEDSLAHVAAEFKAQARGEKTLAPSIPCLRSDGEIFYADVNVALVEVDGKDCMVGFFTDVSERKRMERMKDDFVSTVSHEIRTPLTSIHGALDLLGRGLAGNLSEKGDELLRIARRNSGRLRALIDDILDIQKIESGKLAFHMRPLDLAPLVEYSIDNNKPFGKQFHVEFVLDDLPRGVKVEGDGDRLSQVMDNLLSNAAKFSPPNSEVEISISRHHEMVRVSVSDHGPGIKREFRKHVFDRFTQADRSVTQEKGGTGLGLSIAKLIVDRHGGEIGFETEPGKGTTFYFDLPEWKG